MRWYRELLPILIMAILIYRIIIQYCDSVFTLFTLTAVGSGSDMSNDNCKRDFCIVLLYQI